MRKQFLATVVGAALLVLGGCAMSPPPGATYSPPAPTALPAAAPATFYRVTCWQPSFFGGGYWRTEILSYSPPRPPTCSPPPPAVYQPYGYGGYGYPYQPYGYGYVRPFVLFPHLFGDWGDDDR